MTREEKIKKKQERSYKRKAKRIAKDESYLHRALIHNKQSISWGRRHKHGLVFTCEMGYPDCEQRRYCNGDC
jgi:hypothetical protein